MKDIMASGMSDLIKLWSDLDHKSSLTITKLYMSRVFLHCLFAVIDWKYEPKVRFAPGNNRPFRCNNSWIIIKSWH